MWYLCIHKWRKLIFPILKEAVDPELPPELVHEENKKVDERKKTVHGGKRPSSTIFKSFDSIEKFESSLPFESIRIGMFNKDLMEIQEMDGTTQLGYVLYDKLKERMTNSVWKRAFSTRNSTTSKILLNEFKWCQPEG